MTQLTAPPESEILLAGEEPRSLAAGLRGFAGDVSQLTKPRITALVVLTAYVGLEVGRDAGGAVASGGFRGVLAAALAGTALACKGASAMNQVLERDTDARMLRTMHRPIPAGRVTPRLALCLGLLLSALGVLVLAACVNPLTAALGAITVASYVLVYTPMKRVSHTCTIVGAVPGALPPVMGYAAATGRLGIEAWAMFAILFLWQLPHFLAIAWLYRDDYARAGLPMLPVVDPDGRATCRQILVGCLTLLPIGLAPAAIGMSGRLYFAGALIAGAAFLAFGLALTLRRTRWHARALFFASLVYLPLVFALMLVDRV
jgi:protoheme IX farnesyltransferase